MKIFAKLALAENNKLNIDYKHVSVIIWVHNLGMSILSSLNKLIQCLFISLIWLRFMEYQPLSVI